MPLLGSTVSKAFQQRIVEFLGGEPLQLLLQRHALDLRGNLVPRIIATASNFFFVSLI
jgi:hypothetical protein